MILNITNWLSKYTNYNIGITLLCSIVQSTIWKFFLPIHYVLSLQGLHIINQNFSQIFIPEQTFHVVKVVLVVKFESLFYSTKEDFYLFSKNNHNSWKTRAYSEQRFDEGILQVALCTILCLSHRWKNTG